jgi:hypothetical protein
MDRREQELSDAYYPMEGWSEEGAEKIPAAMTRLREKAASGG